MELREQYDFSILVNEAEKMVIDEMERQLALPENRDVCRLSECVLDIAALALNQMQPLYRANLLGRLYADAIDREHADEVHAAVQRAIEKVRRDPPQ